MSCCRHPSRKAPPQRSKVTTEEEELLSIPAAQLTLVDSNDSLELCHGDFTILKLIQEGAIIAIIVKVGDDYQWPLTKDEPVVKLDDLHYLFSVKPPSTKQKKKDEFISYGVKFCERSRAVDALDAFLNENSCFTAAKAEATTPVAEAPTKVSCWGRWKGLEDDNWKKYAPNVENYHGILAKAIASGSGEVVKGVFICSNAYRSALQNGSEALTNDLKVEAGSSSKNKGLARNSLKRVRKMSKMTERLSHNVLEGVVSVAGSVTGSVVKSSAGKRLMSLVPGEVLLVSLDAVDKVLEALEVAGKDALSVTAGATTKIVSERFGDEAGDVTNDVLATAGHALGTAWNMFKIRKALNPASKESISKAIVKNAIKK